MHDPAQKVDANRAGPHEPLCGHDDWYEHRYTCPHCEAVWIAVEEADRVKQALAMILDAIPAAKEARVAADLVDTIVDHTGHLQRSDTFWAELEDWADSISVCADEPSPVYRQGAQAARDGEALSSNPYERGGAGASEWEIGFLEARDVLSRPRAKVKTTKGQV